MYKVCKTDQSARRQQQMEQALLDAMEKRRYEEITVVGLCQGMGVPRKAFYRYFDSKDDALYALLDHTLLDCSRAMLAGSEERQKLENYFRFWLDRRKLLDALERSGLSGQLIERALWHNTAQGEMPSPLGPKGREEILVLLTMVLVVQWHHSGYRQPPEEMAAGLTRLLSAPLLH